MLFEAMRILYLFGPAYAADVMPILARGRLVRLAKPIDGGLTFGGRPIFGSHKTWRGFVAGTIGGMVVYEGQVAAHALGLFGDLAVIDYPAHPVLPGFLMALGALVGDSVKSLLKRRIEIAPGASWLFFDQLDFFLGASAFVAIVQPLPLLPWLTALPIVFGADIAVCILAYGAGLKEAWL